MLSKIPQHALDKKNDLVHFSNSILHHYGHKGFHEGIPEVESLLEGRRKICVFLLDGLGEEVLKMYKGLGKKLLNNKFMTIQSTNPPTTAAATIAFLTGKYPVETGRLGWSSYIPDLGYPINVFTNVNSLNEQPLSEPDVIGSYCPITGIDVLLREVGVNAKLLYENGIGGAEGPKTIEEMGAQAAKFFDEGGEFLYAYWTNPDGLLHHYGFENHKVKKCIKDLIKMVEGFAKSHPDVLTFCMADHGHTSVIYRDIGKIPAFASLLARPISIEPRCVSFAIKPGKKEEFERVFEEYFGKQFILVSAKEALEANFFGEGEMHYLVPSFIGDYLAIATGEDCIADSKMYERIHVLETQHAGITPQELNINLAVYNK